MCRFCNDMYMSRVGKIIDTAINVGILMGRARMHGDKKFAKHGNNVYLCTDLPIVRFALYCLTKLLGWWNGRHEGLKILWPLRLCGFKSRSEYRGCLQISIWVASFFVGLLISLLWGVLGIKLKRATRHY